jgi:PTS system nitrogen regulatory IIA component
LSELLSAGGIHHDVGGRDKASVLREIVQRLPLPVEVDREFLVTTLEAREAMGSTGIGDGIAIPHVRNPILLHIATPFVTLCLLRDPVNFDALDGKPVHALFTVVSSNVPAHLRILGQLGFVLHDEQLRRLLVRRSPAAEILVRVQAVEGRASGVYTAPASGSEP